MAFVLDVSVTFAWCFADEATPEAWDLLERLPQEEAQVPALWLWEVGNVLVQAERRQRITPAASSEFLSLLETLPIRLEPPAIGKVWHDTLALARSHRLTAYDAAYLELAMRQGLAIASRDQALIQAAQAVGVPHLRT
jgi:predicted nucleic acid-binding protein